MLISFSDVLSTFCTLILTLRSEFIRLYTRATKFCTKYNLMLYTQRLLSPALTTAISSWLSAHLYVSSFSSAALFTGEEVSAKHCGIAPDSPTTRPEKIRLCGFENEVTGNLKVLLKISALVPSGPGRWRSSCILFLRAT